MAKAMPKKLLNIPKAKAGSPAVGIGHFQSHMEGVFAENSPPNSPPSDILDKRRDKPIFRLVPKLLRTNDLEWY